VIRVDGKRVGWDEAGHRRVSARELARTGAGIGMVFQHFYLWPHMVALENVIESLVTVTGMPVSEAATRGRALLEKVGWRTRWRPIPNTSRAASASAWRSPARWPWTRASCCSTSRPRRWTPSWWAKCYA
jgi:ABC-type histidine transport system ATPase subunit